MFVIRFVSLNRNLVLPQICSNYLRFNSLKNIIPITTQTKRSVHSTNSYEIDYLLTKYKLSVGGNGRQSYGQKSCLHHFNSIDDFNFENEKDITIEVLKRVLDIRKTDANLLVKNFPNLMEMSAEKVSKQVQMLDHMFVLTRDHYLSCPWILYLPINFISERMKPFGRKDLKSDDLVLLLLSFKSFERVVKRIKGKKFRTNIFEDFDKKRILFTSNLNIIDEQFCDLIHENMFIFYYDFERLEAVMDVLVSAGIKSNTISADIRVFTHNIPLMKKRIDQCLRHNMPIKTWMLRSPEEVFLVSLRRHVDNKKVLKDYDNNIEYMANQLKCDKEVVDSMTRRYPRIIKISAKKLCQMLSYLFGNGFTSYHIVDTPKILFHSVDTIVERVRQLATINIKLNSLKILTLSDKEFDKLFHQLESIRSNDHNLD